MLSRNGLSFMWPATSIRAHGLLFLHCKARKIKLLLLLLIKMYTPTSLLGSAEMKAIRNVKKTMQILKTNLKQFNSVQYLNKKPSA